MIASTSVEAASSKHLCHFSRRRAWVRFWYPMLILCLALPSCVFPRDGGLRCFFLDAITFGTWASRHFVQKSRDASVDKDFFAEESVPKFPYSPASSSSGSGNATECDQHAMEGLTTGDREY